MRIQSEVRHSTIERIKRLKIKGGHKNYSEVTSEALRLYELSLKGNIKIVDKNGEVTRLQVL